MEPSSAASQSATVKAPVEISRLATPKRQPPSAPRTRAMAAKALARAGSSSASSVMVPGVTSRTTSRLTTDLAPRFFASAGSSICSQTATRWPSAMSFCR